MYEEKRAAILGGRVLHVEDLLEKAGDPGFEVIHIIAKRITDISDELDMLTDLCLSLATQAKQEVRR